MCHRFRTTYNNTCMKRITLLDHMGGGGGGGRGVGGEKDSLHVRRQNKLRVYHTKCAHIASHNIFDWMASWLHVSPKNLIGFVNRRQEKHGC